MSLDRFFSWFRKNDSKVNRGPFSFVYLFTEAEIRNEWNLTGLLPVIGYAMVVASLGDFVYLLFPFKFQDPNWELQTLGLLVEQCWGFLIALALIFSRYFLENRSEIRRIELVLLRGIRWLVFIMALLLILSSPLILADTVRVHRTINQQVGMANAAQLAQIQQIKAQVEQVSDSVTLRAIGQSVGVAEQSFEDEPSLVELKGLVNTRLNVIETNIEAQIARSQREQSQRLIKSSARTLYSGLIISFSFLFIWAKLGRFFRNFNY